MMNRSRAKTTVASSQTSVLSAALSLATRSKKKPIFGVRYKVDLQSSQRNASTATPIGWTFSERQMSPSAGAGEVAKKKKIHRKTINI